MSNAEKRKEDSGQIEFVDYKVLRSLEDDRVFLVVNLVNGTLSALKVATKDSLEDNIFNLRREFVMHANFQHPNIVALGDPLEDTSRFGFTTSYIGGGDLRGRIKSIKRNQISLILKDIAMGLAHIHEKGFVHSDIKPENILISTTGKPVICDFGVTRDLKVRRVDSKSMIFGTAKYLSPEYVMHGDLGAYTDVYSLGLIALEMFSGSVPGDSLDTIDMLRMRVQSFKKDVFDKVPLGLKELIIGALESDPKNRVRDGAQFVEVVNEYISKVNLEDSELARHVRLRVSSDNRPVRLRQITGIIKVDRKAA